MIKKLNKGFTLIELLVVIGIIAILASVVLLALNTARVKSRDSKRISDTKQLSTAFEIYYNEWGGYPADPASLIPDYTPLLPTAPLPFDGSCTEAQNQYTYLPVGSVFTSLKDDTTQIYPEYAYTFCLGNDVQGIADGPHTLTQNGIE